MTSFVDRVTLKVAGGHGGHGCVSTKREKYKPLGGSDGGDGGHGGSVILKVDFQTTTLLSYHHVSIRKAGNGGGGKGGYRSGKLGEDVILPVPVGTVVKNVAGEVLADLTEVGTEYFAASGGHGGLGNSSLVSVRRKAPGFALLGEPGEEKELVLEIKTMADIALVGYPSAGKSSLISVISAARPKVADYPFTTLIPNLGVVEAGEIRFTVADVPGLIPGASEGKGLGLDFLRHVERCAALVHVIDCATLDNFRDPISDLETIEKELAAYDLDNSLTVGAKLAVPLHERPKLVALNKIDVPEAFELAELVTEELEKKGYQVFQISTTSHVGLRQLTFAMAKLVDLARTELKNVQTERIVLRPKSVDDVGFNVVVEKNHEDVFYRILGEKPQRWVVQTDFSNDEAIGYLSDRLANLGIEQALFKAGAIPGSTVVIGPGEGVIFDWEPTIVGGNEVLASPRGTDIRINENDRPTRKEKREKYYDTMDAKAAARAQLERERESGLWVEDSNKNL